MIRMLERNRRDNGLDFWGQVDPEERSCEIFSLCCLGVSQFGHKR
jgi:hypothetical protein